MYVLLCQSTALLLSIFKKNLYIWPILMSQSPGVNSIADWMRWFTKGFIIILLIMSTIFHAHVFMGNMMMRNDLLFFHGQLSKV